MIYDKISNIGKYRGMGKWLDLAVDFLEQTDLKTLPSGRTEIAGDNVFVNVMEAEAKDADAGKFEIHKKYMDIQIDIEGTEIIQTGTEEAEALDPFDEETDFGTVSCECKASCVMGADRFIICMAGEPHKPGIKANEDRHLKKCVLKVAAD